MYSNKFVLSIIHDGHPVKETGSWANKEVAIPFNSEYKIRLKNKNDRSCTARVFVDGKKVSGLGDFIITRGSSTDLERFVTSSLKQGKKFKFVSLDDPNVDDPTSSHNGIVKVEFRLAKEENGIKIQWPEPIVWKPIEPFRFNDWSFNYTSKTFSSDVYYTNLDSDTTMKRCSGKGTTPCAVADGATVEGDHSNQSFTYSDLEVEDHPTAILRLKLVGIVGDIRKVREHKYCSQCGYEVGRKDRYCSACGRRM